MANHKHKATNFMQPPMFCRRHHGQYQQSDVFHHATTRSTQIGAFGGSGQAFFVMVVGDHNATQAHPIVKGNRAAPKGALWVVVSDASRNGWKKIPSKVSAAANDSSDTVVVVMDRDDQRDPQGGECDRWENPQQPTIRNGVHAVGRLFGCLGGSMLFPKSMQDVENDRYTDAAACEATHQGGGHAIWFLLGFFWTTAASILHGLHALQMRALVRSHRLDLSRMCYRYILIRTFALLRGAIGAIGAIGAVKFQ